MAFEPDNHSNLTLVYREISILRQLREIGGNKFTTELNEVLFDSEDVKEVKEVYLVMEFVMSDLDKIIKNRDTSNFSDTNIKIILYNLLCALNFIHTAGILHRDFKPGNVLVNTEC
jgi:serine/threonine protein kinase